MRYITGLAFLLLLIGTYFLAEQRFVWDGVLFIVLAMLALAMQSAFTRPGRLRAWAWLARVAPRSPDASMRVGALALSACVALAANSRSSPESFGALLLLWVSAIVLFLLTVIGPALGDRATSAHLTPAERWGLGALFLVSFLVRGIAVGQVPANLGGDEGTQLTAALDLVASPMGNPFATGWYSVPTMSFLAYGAAMRLFGATVAGGRMLSVLVGTLSVFTTFLLARSLAGRLIGWAAAVTLSISAYHIHFSRLASNQVADPLIGTLTLWLVWRALAPGGSTPSPRQAAWLGRGTRPTQGLWGLAGVVAGLGWYAYFGARWVTVLVILVLFWRWLMDRSLLRRHWRGLAFFAVGWLVVTLPLWGWYATHPSALYERYAVVGVFSSGWMARERLLTGRSMASLVLQQLWRSITAFHLTHDPTFWYRPDQPLVDFVTGALMLVGIVDALLRARWPSRGLAHLWFWPTAMMAWGLTENPPSSQRGLLLLPPVVLFAAWGIERLSALLSLPRRHYPRLAAVLLTLAGAINLAFYFGVYTPSEVYGNPSAQAATQFATYMRANPEPICEPTRPVTCQGQVYFLGPPWLYWRFGSLAFLLRGYAGVDVAQGELPTGVAAPARFVVVPERAEQVSRIRSLWPGGTETELYASDGRLLMWIYDWTGAY